MVTGHPAIAALRRQVLPRTDRTTPGARGRRRPCSPDCHGRRRPCSASSQCWPWSPDCHGRCRRLRDRSGSALDEGSRGIHQPSGTGAALPTTRSSDLPCLTLALRLALRLEECGGRCRHGPPRTRTPSSAASPPTSIRLSGRTAPRAHRDRSRAVTPIPHSVGGRCGARLHRVGPCHAVDPARRAARPRWAGTSRRALRAQRPADSFRAAGRCQRDAHPGLRELTDARPDRREPTAARLDYPEGAAPPDLRFDRAVRQHEGPQRTARPHRQCDEPPTANERHRTPRLPDGEGSGTACHRPWGPSSQSPGEMVEATGAYASMASTQRMSGGVLLSHAVSHAVPSALKSLASGFGMRPGVSSSL